MTGAPGACAPTIALVIRRYDHTGGGAERWTHGHAVALLRSGWKVRIVGERITGAPAGAECRTVPVEGGWWRDRSLAFARGAEEAARGADLIVDMGYGACGGVVIPHFGTRAANDRARMAMRTPLQRLARAVSTRVLPRRRRLAALERASVASAQWVVAVSRMTAADLTRDLGLEAGRVLVVPNGVDLSRFRPADAGERERARRALGLGDRPGALLVAHDFRLKGVPAAVRAVADLHRADPAGAPALIVVGRDPQRPIAHLAARLGVAHLVRLEGARDDSLLYYHAADVLVHPTYYDPCSLVALEAAACGVPVVTTRANGAAELMEGDAGCVIVEDPGDHRALSRAVAQVLQPETSQRMRQGALRRRPLLDGAAGQGSLEGLYRSVIASRRQGAPEGKPGPGRHGGLPAGAGGSRAAAR